MQKKASFLVSVLDHLRTRLPSEEHGLATVFTRKLWAGVPDEELEGRDTEDAAGATITSLRKFQVRQPTDVVVEVMNPNFERDGWGSEHTVVLIVHPDMPFIIDSVLMELSGHELGVHQLQNVVFSAVRDAGGQLQGFDGQVSSARREVLIYAEVDRVDAERARSLTARLLEILADVRVVVGDFSAMTRRLQVIADALEQSPPPLPSDDVAESVAFLKWLREDNFTFLGYRAFDFSDGVMRQEADSALGIMRNRKVASERSLDNQPEETRRFLLEPVALAFSKSGTRSQVHRPAYPDYIAVKQFDEAGHVIGEHGFLGLFTSRVYMEEPRRIPIIRQRVARIMERSGHEPGGFDSKALAQVLATYPRDELFLSTEDELFDNALAISHIHERRKTQVFVRRGRYGLFYTVLVFMPRDLFHTSLRIRIQELLIDALAAEDAPFEAYFSESILVRLQFTIRLTAGTPVDVDIADVCNRIIALTRDWTQDFRQALTQEFGEAQGNRYARVYQDAFPAGYREHFAVRAAVHDVMDMERLTAAQSLNMRFYRNPEDPPSTTFLKLFHLDDPLPLSDILPSLENMGVRVIGERAFRVRRTDGACIAIHEFQLEHNGPFDISEIGDNFEAAFVRVWDGRADDDSLNRLVVAARLDYRRVAVLRAYARYIKQIRFGFSQDFIADTLTAHPAIAARLVTYFEERLDPEGDGDGSATRDAIIQALDDVALLNEDRILRRFLEVLGATLRTNFWQRDDNGEPKPYLALKLAPRSISGVPAPAPEFEIFVSSARFEGVHLRSGAIARGGLRWSDRLEDYRTEVLGLVKAQVVKNAVIVPTGAKGGFVLRRPPADREAYAAEGIACYRQFISGLLDVTDNIGPEGIVPPKDVRRHDGDDPYLVVAADKGTAAFSDFANEEAEGHGFWLGDAFASGGSNGYDHKKMGITARGAWISVQRHFSERGVDVQSDAVSVLGIGDMSGDVFGNGMLLSSSIELVAAFNHLHIFIDPYPDAAVSFAERKRLFALPRSGWGDYDVSLISPGGGVFERSLKSIALSPEMKQRFATEAEVLSPDELIHELLKAPVDLIWNGGIGTYVRASTETDAEVGDRANDHIRVAASELRAKAFGEGGNLGLTQRARIEFSLAGGAVNTDFIDNAGGVDSSDREVNIKILLNQQVANGDLTIKQRNELLESMTGDVAELVLTNNFRQAQALSLAEHHARERGAEYQRLISRMETDQGLDRELEDIPSDEVLADRAAGGQGLTRPELAVLLSYSKMYLKNRLVISMIHTDPVIADEAFSEFPGVIGERFPDAVRAHRLNREIIATVVANDVVHHLGVSSVVHLSEFVGGEVEDIVRAYYAAAVCFAIRDKFHAVEQAEGVSGDVKVSMLLQLMRLARRGTRWFLRHRRDDLDVQNLIDYFGPRISLLAQRHSDLLGASGAARRRRRIERRLAEGVPPELAESTDNAAALAMTLPVIDSADARGVDPLRVAETFSCLDHALGFDWLSEQLARVPGDSLWQSMERDALLDELVTLHATLAAGIHNDDGVEISRCVDAWLSDHAGLVGSWRRTLEEAQRTTTPDFSLFSMTLRKLGDLTKAVA